MYGVGNTPGVAAIRTVNYHLDDPDRAGWKLGTLRTRNFLARLSRDGAILGYSYAARFHDRAGYRHTVSTTVYLDRHLLGQGLGAALYGALLDRLPALGVHAAIGTISWPNPASVALHEKMGFTTVGRLPQIGFKFGNWIDVVYLHRTFDAP